LVSHCIVREINDVVSDELGLCDPNLDIVFSVVPAFLGVEEGELEAVLWVSGEYVLAGGDRAEDVAQLEGDCLAACHRGRECVGYSDHSQDVVVDAVGSCCEVGNCSA
jgi:hypothetical protein